MKRNIMSRLVEWKNRSHRKLLLLTGVRQCGKTYIIRKFGKEEFEDTAYFNFEEDETLSSAFDHDFKIERILDDLGSIRRGEKIVPGKSLLILDEIQACPRAITSLKYFCENQPDLHVIVASYSTGMNSLFTSKVH